MLTAEIHPYGEPAARALASAVAAAKGGDPLAPVTVVVPSNHVGVASRRLLASGALGPVAGAGAGIAAVAFLTTYRLAELLGSAALAAEGRRPVSTPVLAAAMRAELALDAGLFGPVAEHPATEAALVATYRELRDCSPAALDSLARTSGRAAEVVRLHRAVRARLAPRWYDEQDLLVAAAAVDPTRARAELGALVVHLPQLVSQHAARLLQALAAHVPTTVIAGTTGVEAADATVRTSLARLGVVPTQGAPAPTLPVDAARTEVVTASDADEEVRTAVRAVVDAVRSGTRLDRIAVLHASPEPYARLAHEHLRASGIHTNGAAVVPLAARLAGRTLIEMLALPAADFRRQDVFAWLAAAPLLHGGRWAPTTAWERLSREAGVVQGRDQWDVRLERLARTLDERAARLEADPDEPESLARRSRDEAARARGLREFVLGVAEDLSRAAARPRRWGAHARWAHQRLHSLLGAEPRREGWPDDEARAAVRVEEAIRRLGALDEVEEAVPLEVFARTLEVELESDLGRVGRFGDGVLVGSIEMGIGLDLDLVVVLGLAEGSFPSTVRDDSLLPDRERVAAAGELGLRADRVERQHAQLVATLAGARRQVLCVPRGDLRRSAERVPSRWVLDVATQVAADGRRWWAADLLGTTLPWIRHVASFDAGLRAMAEPATDQEHRLRALLSAGGSLEATSDARTALGAEVIAARRSDRFTRFDGNLADEQVPSPLAGVTSPTRLERWASCPHAHFVQDVLGAVPVENPEDALTISALDKGNLVHEALEEFVRRAIDRAGDGEVLPWMVSDRDLLDQIGAAMCDKYEGLGVTGRSLYWRRDRRRILDDLGEFLLQDSIRRVRTATRPSAVELGFGFDDGLPPVAVELPGGRTLSIRGKVDRIDLAEDGTVHVIDYKTGKAERFRKLTPEAPVAAGTKLQLPIYGLAGRQHQGRADARVWAEYWFVTSRGGFQPIGYEVTDEVLERARAVLVEIVEGIEAGVFAPRPAPVGSTHIFIDCQFCDPDGLGTVELRRQWERKREDPALARYARLAEPLLDDAEGEAVDVDVDVVAS